MKKKEVFGELSPGQPPLSEENFIHEERVCRSLSFWSWAFVSFLFMLALFAGGRYVRQFEELTKRDDPFLAVTNREFSLFLWQFPSFMRLHAPTKGKSAYLPGFFSDRENMELSATDALVVAPPDLLFLYHTWQRLLAKPFIPRSISPLEFEKFLMQLPEWQPQNWKEAPKFYVKWVESKAYAAEENLQTASEEVLPLIVRQAFVGWKNYFVEGREINQFRPTFAQVSSFLERYPHYARNYWRNIFQIKGKQVAGLNYLASFVNSLSQEQLEQEVPQDQLASFLLVAMFNFIKAQEEGRSQSPLHR